MTRAILAALAALLLLPGIASAFPWSEPEVVAEGTQPLLKIGPGEVQYLAYSRPGGGAELRTRAPGDRWSEPETIASDGGVVEIDVARDGHVLADLGPVGERRRFSVRSPGGAWVSELTPDGIERARVALGDGGLIALAGVSGEAVVAATRQPGGTFDAPTQVTRPTGEPGTQPSPGLLDVTVVDRQPVVAWEVDVDGGSSVTWSDRTHEWEPFGNAYYPYASEPGTRLRMLDLATAGTEPVLVALGGSRTFELYAEGGGGGGTVDPSTTSRLTTGLTWKYAFMESEQAFPQFNWRSMRIGWSAAGGGRGHGVPVAADATTAHGAAAALDPLDRMVAVWSERYASGSRIAFRRATDDWHYWCDQRTIAPTAAEGDLALAVSDQSIALAWQRQGSPTIEFSGYTPEADCPGERPPKADPPPPDPTDPGVATVDRRGSVDSARRRAWVMVRCRGEARCSGTVGLRRGSARVARTTFSVRPGTKKRFRLRLTKFGRRTVRRRAVKVAARVRTAQAVTERRVTLRHTR